MCMAAYCGRVRVVRVGAARAVCGVGPDSTFDLLAFTFVVCYR